MATTPSPIPRTLRSAGARAGLELAALTALVLVGLVLWSLVDGDTDVLPPLGLAGLAVLGVTLVGVTAALEAAARRRGERPGELGNVSRLLAVAAVLIALPAMAVQVIEVEEVPASGFAPHACPSDTVPDAGFADAVDHTHARAVSCGVWWELVTGVDEARFAPNDPITVRQMNAILSRVAVSAGDGAAVDVGDGRAGAVVSRAQLAAELWDAYAALSPDRPGPVVDAFRDDEGHALEPHVNRAAAAGFVAGTGDRTFAPDRPVTRAQALTGVLRLVDRLVVEARLDRPS